MHNLQHFIAAIVRNNDRVNISEKRFLFGPPKPAESYFLKFRIVLLNS